MTKYYVSRATKSGRIKTTKYWLKKSEAQNYADQTNENSYRAYARVVKGD